MSETPTSPEAEKQRALGKIMQAFAKIQRAGEQISTTNKVESDRILAFVNLFNCKYDNDLFKNFENASILANNNPKSEEYRDNKEQAYAEWRGSAYEKLLEIDQEEFLKEIKGLWNSLKDNSGLTRQFKQSLNQALNNLQTLINAFQARYKQP